MNARRLVLIFALVSVACGSTLSPTGDAAQQPAGAWLGTVTQTTASGSTTECLLAFQSSNGVPDTYSLTIAQNGTALTASAASATTGQVCNFERDPVGHQHQPDRLGVQPEQRSSSRATALPATCT